MPESGLLGGDRDLLMRYWRDVADGIGLYEWSFKLADDPPPKSPDDPSGGVEVDGAMISFIYGRKYAVLYISDDWAGWEPDELRYVIVHEMVHVHLHGMTMAMNNLQNHIPLAIMDVFRGSYRDANELATDGIAANWSKMFALPDEWLEAATAP